MRTRPVLLHLYLGGSPIFTPPLSLEGRIYTLSTKYIDCTKWTLGFLPAMASAMWEMNPPSVT